MSTDRKILSPMGSLWRLVRVLVVPCGRRGLGILALASLALGLHVWLAGSVLAPFVRDGEVEYLFVSANVGTVAGSMVAAGLLAFGLHGLVRRVARRVAPCGARTEHDLFAPSDVAWARPLHCCGVSLLALGSFVPGLAPVLPVLSYVVVDLRWWWTLPVAFWVLVGLDRRLGGAVRVRVGTAAARVPAASGAGRPWRRWRPWR